MTDDASPENLRKFLESDDPALVRMGISLAKGAGVEVTIKDLERFLKSDDVETIKTGVMLADEAGVGDEAMEMLCESLANDNEEVCQATAEALGEIGDVRAVEPLIKALNVIDEINFIRQYREWNPDWEDIEVFTAVVEALEKLGDVRAVGPLARALESENLWMKSGNDTLYHGFFTIPIVEAMIGIGIDTITENERSKAGGHLRLMLEIGSGEEPIPFPGDHFYDERIAELICVVGPAYCSHWRIASCSGFMPALRETDETFCELLIQNLENRTQSLIRIMEESRGIYSRAAAEALDRLGWQPDTDELRANYLIATEQWAQCSNLGASAVEPLIGELEYELAEFRSGRSASEDGEDEIALEPIVRVLGEIGDARAVEPLKWIVRDEESTVRNAAVEALGKIGDARAVEPLIEALEMGQTAEAAVEALGELGWKPETDELRVVYLLAKGDTEAFVMWGESAIDPLIKVLKDKTFIFQSTRRRFLSNEHVRVAAKALGKIGGARAVEALIEAHGNEDRDVRETTAEALGEIGDERAVGPLIKALGDGDRDVRRNVAEALDKLRWKPETDGQRGAYLIAVQNWESLVEWGEPAVEPLVKALVGHEFNDVHEAAADVLGKIGKPAVEPLIEPLVEAISDENSDVRKAATVALDKLGWVPEIDEQRGAYLIAVQNWESLVEWGEPAVEPLIKALGDGDRDVRRNVAEALDKLRWKPETDGQRGAYLIAVQNWESLVEWGEPAVEPLVKALVGHEEINSFGVGPYFGGEFNDIRRAVLGTLGDMGYYLSKFVYDRRIIGKPAVEPLIKLLGDVNKEVREVAADALGELGNPNGIEPLVEAISDENSDVRKAATVALDKLGWVPEIDEQRGAYLIAVQNWESLIECGEPVVEPLIKALQDNDVRESVSEVLGKIGDERAVNPLIKALGDDDDSFRSASAYALGEIGDARAVEMLIGVLSDDDEVRSAAAAALGKISDVRAVEPLIEIMRDEEWKVRVSAAWALGEIGDVRAVEPLIKALRDKNENVRQYAVESLDALGWEPDTEQFQFEQLLASSGLRLSNVPTEAQKGLAEHCKLLLSHEKILNLEQEEFANIVEDRNGSLETIENPCTAEELIELLAGASSQTRWIVACGVVEICCYDGATMDKIIDARGKQINIFWSRISAYSNPITKADRDEMVGVLKRLPPVLFVHIGGCLYNFVVETNIDKKASAVMKKNSEMITTIFVDPDLAKAMLGM